MSTIDSGLGWSCDSDYYVDTTGILGTYGGKTISKNNNVGAICVNYQYNDGIHPITYGAFIISTDASAVVCSGTLGHDVDTSIVDNVMWYRCNIYHPSESPSSKILTDFPVLNTIFTPSTTNQTQIVLTESGVQFTAKKIPTTDYVKAFVEGVEAETAERVNAAYDMIAPAFSTSENYSADDIVIYGGKLYKCVSAHSAGAWVSADFSETSLAELIKGET